MKQQQIGLQEILDRIPSLSKNELKQLQASVSALLQFDKADDIEDTNTLMVLSVIRSCLESRGLEFPPMRLLRNWPGYEAFTSKVGALMKFVHRSKLTRGESHAMLTMGVNLLVDNMQQMSITVNGRSIMNHIHRVPSVITREFPGYVENDVLSKILRRKTGAKK